MEAFSVRVSAYIPVSFHKIANDDPLHTETFQTTMFILFNLLYKQPIQSFMENCSSKQEDDTLSSDMRSNFSIVILMFQL